MHNFRLFAFFLLKAALSEKVGQESVCETSGSPSQLHSRLLGRLVDAGHCNKLAAATLVKLNQILAVRVVGCFFFFPLCCVAIVTFRTLTVVMGVKLVTRGSESSESYLPVNDSTVDVAPWLCLLGSTSGCISDLTSIFRLYDSIGATAVFLLSLFFFPGESQLLEKLNEWPLRCARLGSARPLRLPQRRKTSDLHRVSYGFSILSNVR